MATRDIRQTIALDGETKLKDAIKSINKEYSVLKSEMSLVTAQFGKNNQSVEKLQAVNEVLNKEIDVQGKKVAELANGLDQAKKAYGESSDQAKNYEIQLNNAKATLVKMENELRDNEQAIEDQARETEDATKETDKFGNELKDAGDQAEKSGSKFEKMGGVLAGVGAALGTAAVAAGAMAVKLGKEVVESFAELEQNLGGSEAVFGEYAASIQKTGEEAYKNLGVSQSDYLATANKMGALFQGSGIEQQKSLDLTEKAMQRAADMASVMGIDMQVALDSVAGAAKGNFTMMDNLGVAMNATNVEAYALANGLDFTWKTASQAEKAEVAMQMFFENTEQYAGNFAKESTETISGSLGLLEAATGSFVAGLGNADADMKNLTENMVDAFEAVVANIVPIIENIVSALPPAIDAILVAVVDLLPLMLDTATSLFSQILTTLLELLPELIPVAVDALLTLVDALIDNLPLIIDAALLLILALVQGLIEALPELIPATVDAIITIVDSLIENLPMIIEAAIELILALVQGLVNALPQLIEWLPTIIESVVSAIVDNLPLLIDAAIDILLALVDAIIDNLPLLIEAAIDILVSLGEGLIKNTGRLLSAVPELLKSLKDKFIETDWGKVGKDILNGISNGLKNAAKGLADAAREAAKNALGAVKDFLGIRSPSRVFRDEVGFMMGEGIVDGLDRSGKDIDKALDNVIPDLEGQYGAALTVGNGTVRHSHSGTIRIEGVNDSGQLIGVVDVVMDRLRMESMLAGG